MEGPILHTFQWMNMDTRVFCRDVQEYLVNVIAKLYIISLKM